MRVIRQVTFDRANRKKDKSISLTFITDLEQSTDEFMEIDKLLGAHGVLHFSDRGTLTTEEVEQLDEVDIELKGKTKSQRLRNVLYILSQQDNVEYKQYYSDKMEEIIEHFKSKIVD